MKRLILTPILLLAFATASLAQVDIYFRINHKLGSSNFSPNHTATNSLGNNFQVDRLDYYISEITLIHDGGQQTPVLDHYVLVKATEQTHDFLGSFNITNLEGIQFGIGVDPGANHSDITLYPANHPLSFQNPSMHWGWAAGYRFVAMEGKSGAAMNQIWELHALGTSNYGYANVSTTGSFNGSDLIISLDADYEQAMDNIAVNGSLNYHGENNQAITILSNFQTLVFSEGASTIGLAENAATQLQIAPNPSKGKVYIELENRGNASYELVISDITGREVMRQDMNGLDHCELEILRKGIYLVSLLEQGELLGTTKLIIQ